MLEALQDSWLAHTIGESQMLTASLSALHLVGFTLIMSSAFVSGLRMIGVTLREMPAIDVVRPATRTLLIGLSISAATGALLFIPRAAGAAANDIFRLKMTLLIGAILMHFTMTTRVAGWQGAGDTGAQKATGALGLALWAGVALAGVAFILLE